MKTDSCTKNGFDTSLIASPSQIIDMATSIAALLQNAKRFINIVTFGIASRERNNIALAPFGGTARVAI